MASRKLLTAAISLSITCALAAAFLHSAAGSGLQAHACTLPLTRNMDLLDGRLSMRVPAAARIEQRQNGIMAAPQSLQEETSVLIESGSSYISFTAWELFATAPADLEQAVRLEVQSDPVTVRPRPVPSGLRLIEFFPNAPQSGANLIWGAYIAQADGTVERIAFYGDGPQAKLPPDCLAKVTEMAATLTPGKRSLNLKGGPTEIGSQVTVNLPPLYASSVQDGTDFTVYKVTKLPPLGSSPATIGLYLGGHPSFHGQGQSRDKVTLFGKASEWHDSTSANEFGSDALVTLDRVGYAHLFLRANSVSELQELKRVAQTMALK